MASLLSIMDYGNELTIELLKKLLTAIPKNRRSYWSEKVDEFYLIYFKNLKLKKNLISKAADEVIDEINASDEEIIDETHTPFNES